MKDSTLLKIALCCSLLGILVILFIVENTEIPKSNISNITKEDLEKTVSITGRINYITETPGLLIITLGDQTGNITAIIFKEENISLTKGQIITLEGQVIEYMNKLEIQAELIKIKKLI
jgi:RecJ-like exonuclease